MTKNTIYSGLDLLKFLMALMVVMIHVKPNAHSEILTNIFTPLMSLSVPVFFLISSFLIFSKLSNKGNLFKWCKRITILYGVWMLIDIWFIIFRREYFSLGWYDGLLSFIKDLLFGTTYPGSWFLSALLVGVVIVFFLTRFLHPYIVLILSLLISLYIRNINYFSGDWLEPYIWYSEHIRKEVALSFPSHLIWISLGQIISLKLNLIESQKNCLLPLSILIFVISYVSMIWIKIPLTIYIFVVVTFLMFFLLRIPNHPIFKRMREISILMFLFHFSIAGKMNMFCSIVGNSLFTNYLYYFLVVGSSIIFAEFILRIEKKKGFEFLRYTH